MRTSAAEARAKVTQSLKNAKNLVDGKLAAEDDVQTHIDGVASDSDVEESEPAWKPLERKIRPHVPGLRSKRLARADLQAEYEEDDCLDVMYGDPEDQLEEVPSEGSDDDHGGELEENSTDDDDRESDDEFDDPDD
ncbi:COPII coat assembly protein SEC16-like [Papaver somniferum]|uniref:COPII coat assembly protein SEC16-like n=1 Tax=Papaver somniferum TaxID=3469 RepID=UPI000E6FD095|nr:COPII coat assembly protein SEC16-like [Papaver somniferum]